MAESAFPLKSRVEREDGEPQYVSFADADEVFEALASETARAIVSALCDDPATPSEVADRAGTSVQNASYHLDRLSTAGLVEVVDQWYSAKGIEMDVYALATDPLVVCVGDERSREAVSHVVEGGAGPEPAQLG